MPPQDANPTPSFGGFGLSQRHALVRPSTDGCLVYDLGSYNGTKVNGVELAGNSLSSGDVVKLGEVEMEFVQKAAT